MGKNTEEEFSPQSRRRKEKSTLDVSFVRREPKVRIRLCGFL
jgi:hypothetical protein